MGGEGVKNWGEGGGVASMSCRAISGSSLILLLPSAD